MSDFLAAMSDASLLRARTAMKEADATSLDSRVASAPPPRALKLAADGFDVIAEAKLASPVEGTLTDGGADRVTQLASRYSAAGATAISVLTEESRFGGSLEHLELVSAQVEVPVMRKDFLVDPIQVQEARAAGASGVLLIARMVPGSLLEEMTDLTLRLGMFALVEIFDRSDLETAATVFDRDVLVGVNCRDLTTLEVDLRRFERLAPHLPDHLPAVAESGIETPSDVGVIADLGYRMALVGSSLVAHEDPAGPLAALIRAGRARLSGAER
ncbi:MAG TPA: indole-3-glycerol-phosphate synthase [Acidimicrobiia bacterium]